MLSVTDANGNAITAPNHIANVNPIRHRGYYYDTETGLYYLNSRYYDPQTGRFLNADDTDVLDEDQNSLSENNLFAYCLNNPINMTDDDGTIAWWIAAAVGGALFDSAVYLVGAAASGHFSWRELGKAALVGAITGVCFGAAGKIASKAFKAIKGAVKARKAIRYTTGTISQIGKIGEKISGVTKNTRKYFINGRWRIPDGMNYKRRMLQEVKNVKRLSLTSQLRDSMQLARPCLKNPRNCIISTK